MEDTRQLGGADVLLLDVLMMMNVIMLMEARQVAVMMKVTGQVLLEVLVLVVVLEEVLLFSLSSTPFPRTRPAARVWASGAKGSDNVQSAHGLPRHSCEPSNPSAVPDRAEGLGAVRALIRE